MRIFIDSANLADIEAALERGFVSGVTTNPSIMARDGTTIPDIIALLQVYGRSIPLSVEVTSADTSTMLHQAYHLIETWGHAYPELTIKVPIGWDELQVVRQLREEDIPVNVTACMSYSQAIMAADAGANYVSLFWGRIRDYVSKIAGPSPADVVRAVHTTFREHNCPTQIIVGSIRSTKDVTDAIQAGADIVTVPPQFLPLLCKHPKTDEVVNQFLRDASVATAR